MARTDRDQDTAPQEIQQYSLNWQALYPIQFPLAASVFSAARRATMDPFIRLRHIMHPCFFVRPPHPPGQVDLDHGQYLRIVFASGWAVQLDAGTALATVYNVREDILLADGMQLIIPNNGLTLVEAIGSCQLRLTSPQTAGLHRTRYWKLPFLYPSMTLGALSVPHEQNFCRVTTALKKKEDLCRADGQTNPLPVCKMSS